MSENPRVQQIVDNLPMIMLDDVRFLLEDRKRLIGEIKRIKSYCAEVEIARRVAESEVAALKAQIAAVETLLASADGSGHVLLRDVHTALSAGEGDKK